MNKLILCEGKTDAILLSYYLGKLCGWSPVRKGPKELQIKEDTNAGETAYWYQREADYLLICAVGSKDRFRTFFDTYIRQPLVAVDAFSKIAAIIDHDEETITGLEHRIQKDLSLIANHAQNGHWVPHTYTNGFGETMTLSVLLQIIPSEQQGALETLLLTAISEDPYDQNIVEKSKAYVDGIAPQANRYIGKRRLVLKAYLGVTWAIQSPQKVFTFIDDQLRSVPWETSETLSNCFRELVKI